MSASFRQVIHELATLSPHTLLTARHVCDTRAAYEELARQARRSGPDERQRTRGSTRQKLLQKTRAHAEKELHPGAWECCGVA